MALALSILAIFTAVSAVAADPSAAPVEQVDHVVDGDTIALANGQRVRLVQIDTPEVYFGVECYGRAASRTTEALLPVGSRVRLFVEPATDRVDQYGRLLRYVVRVNRALNVNVRLVALGAAAPYFYRGRRGRYAGLLETDEEARTLEGLPSHPLRSLPGRPNATLRRDGMRVHFTAGMLAVVLVLAGDGSGHTTRQRRAGDELHAEQLPV